MPAFHFYTLYFQIDKLRSEELLHYSNIISIPHMENKDRSQVLQFYRLSASDTVELIEDNNDFSNLSKLKSKLNK